MNSGGIFRGRAPVPLDGLGKEQAKALARALRERPSFVFSSPLCRAMETASIAGGQAGLPEPLPLEGLTDMDFGEIEGLSEERVGRDYPGLLELWKTDPVKARFPGGESLGDVAGRAWECLVSTAREHEGETLFVVTHRVVTKVLVLMALGSPLGAFWRVQQSTACMNLLDLAGDGFIVRRVNDTCHLEGLEPDARDF